MSNPSAVDQKLGIPGIAEVVLGNGGLSKVRITSAKTAGEIYLLGAHVAAWKPAGSADVLWLSKESWWQDGKPIRGGVPICFPWFGPRADDPQAPGHGFARITQWHLDSITHENGEVTVGLSTKSNDSTKKWWPADFELRYHVTFGTKLVMRLELTNTGASTLHAQNALHTYFSVGDVRQVSINGLDSVHYLDRADGGKEETQEGAIHIAAETNRLYLNTTHATEIDDPVFHRSLRVNKQGSSETVVWNPWTTQSKTMPDFGDEEWPGMVCVETCNVSKPVELAPGKQHVMVATIDIAAI
jgi:glucose-6-phosphate 1-epimerase